MKTFPTLLLITIAIGVVQCHFYPYPRFKSFSDNGDPGKALYLTEYIEKGEFELAKSLATVHIDDLQWLLSYSGYLTVNKTYNSNLFFWYFPAKNNPSTAPVVLYLQGGPGASSMFAIFVENGPFSLTADKKLKPRKYSWHLDHNVLYIDNPVGTGFSFTDSDAGYATNEVDVGNDLYSAMTQFFTLFSEVRDNPFYISGESYAGKYIPALGHAILRNLENTDPKNRINLQGLLIGDGYTDPVHQSNYGDYLYQLGMIDTNGRNMFVEYEKKAIIAMENGDFVSASNIIDTLINGEKDTLFTNLTGSHWYYNYLQTDGDYYYNADKMMGDYLQTSVIRKAIHVGNNSFHDSDGQNKVAEFLKADIMDSVSSWVAELLAHYRVLAYNGQLDIICAYPMTVNYLKKLKFDAAGEYKVAPRYIWMVDDEVAGYVKTAGNLTELLVRNSGHMVPAEQPKWALDMLNRFTTGQNFH